jgi:4-oxalocrotonate tautomerase
MDSRSRMNPMREEEVIIMPIAQVKVIEGVFSDSQKHEMIEKVTDAIVSVEGEGLRDKTYVIIEEIKSGDWGIGGEALSTKVVKDIAQRKAS